MDDGQHQASRTETVREFVTMALYISLSLLAVTLATPAPDGGPSAFTVLLTALGLVLAHLLAFSMSSRLVNHGLLDPASLRLLSVQATAGLMVAVTAALPVLLLPSPYGLAAATALLVLLIGLTGYRAARSGGASPVRAVAYVVSVAVAAAVVLGVKSLVH